MTSDAASRAPVCELRGAFPCGRAAALDDHDRHFPTDPPGDPREAPRIAERLDVEQGYPGRVVGLPVLEEVIRGDVGAVADRSERGDAEPAVLARSIRASPRAPLWVAKPTSPAGGLSGAKVALNCDARRRVQDAEAVRADQPDAGGPADLDQLALAFGSVRPRLGESGRDHDQRPAHPARRTPRDLDHGRRRDGDHRQVDVIREVRDARVGANRLNHVRARDSPDRRHPRSPDSSSVVEELAADGVRDCAKHRSPPPPAARGSGEAQHAPQAGLVPRSARPRSSENEVGSSRWIEPGWDDISTGKPLSRKTSIIRWLSGMHLRREHGDPVVLWRPPRGGRAAASPARSLQVARRSRMRPRPRPGRRWSSCPERRRSSFASRIATSRSAASSRHPPSSGPPPPGRCRRRRTGTCANPGRAPRGTVEHRVFVLGPDGADMNSRAVA